MEPVVDRLRQEYAGRIRVRVVGAGVNDYEELSARYGIEYVPTFVFLDSDGTQHGEIIVGEVSESALRARIEALD